MIELVLENKDTCSIVFFDLGQDQRALIEFTQALIADPTYAPAYHFRGLIYNSTHTPRKERVFPPVT
jgi:Tfp pilus assembly protein PilF